MKFDKSLQDKLLRVILRWIPILPGPELYDLVREVKRSQDGIDSQVSEAIASIHKTSELVAQLENSLKERSEKVEKLRREHERLSKLAKIEEDMAKPLLEQVELAIDKNQRRERWASFWINIAAGLVLFILGVLLSDPLKKWLLAMWHFVTGEQ